MGQRPLTIAGNGLGQSSTAARPDADRPSRLRLARLFHCRIGEQLGTHPLRERDVTNSRRSNCPDSGHHFGTPKGVPITDYCDQNRLTVRERLALFIQVCQAIQHAHHKGIIHRDLKPSNVLITLHDGKPVPKVIDFGVAKALNTRLTDKTVYTEHFQVVGTLLYMSPEQAELSGLDVDTRSDIYSLGVLLYELLTGTTPFQKEEISQAGIDEQRRMIRDKEPPRASVRISSLGATATSIAEQRKTDVRHLLQEVSDDLDWILLKALDKDRTRRYESASRFASDVERFLSNEPLMARPPSATYRFRKYVARNKNLVAVFALVTLCVFAVIGSLVYGFVEKSRLNTKLEEALAKLEDERNRAKATLRQLGDELADRTVDAAFSGQPAEFQEAFSRAALAEAPEDLLDTVRGLSMFFDGQNTDAIKQLELARRSHPQSISALSALAWVYHHLNFQTEREEVYDDIRSLPRHSSGKPYEEFFACLSRYIGGSGHELRLTLKRLDSLLSRRSRWGAAFALRAGVQMEIAMETKQLTDFERAVDDFREAKTILPDSSFVKTTGLYVLTTAIEFAKHKAHSVPGWQSEARELADGFSALGDGSLAHARSAVFFYHDGEEERAREIELDFGRHVPSAAEQTAVQILRGEPLQDIVQSLAIRESDPEAFLARAIVRALSPNCDRSEAIELLDTFTAREDVPKALYVLAFDLAYVLRAPDKIKELVDRGQLDEKLKPEWRWWNYCVDYHVGRIDEESLLSLAEPFSNSTCIVEYAIAMRAMGDGDVDKAKQHFERTIATRRVGWWNYHWAKVYLRHLEM